MNLREQVCTPSQATEFSAHGFTTKNSLYTWIMEFELVKVKRRNEVYQTTKLYYRADLINQLILVSKHRDVYPFIRHFAPGEKKQAYSGPAFTTAELGKMIGPNCEFAKFGVLDDEMAWGYKDNKVSNIHYTEAESRAFILIGMLETKSITVQTALSNLEYVSSYPF